MQEAAFLFFGLLLLLAIRAITQVADAGADEGAGERDVCLCLRSVPYWRQKPGRLCEGQCAVQITRTHLVIVPTGLSSFAPGSHTLQTLYVPLDKVVDIEQLPPAWPRPNVKIEFLDSSMKFESIFLRTQQRENLVATIDQSR